MYHVNKMYHKTRLIQFDGLGTRWQCEIFCDINDDKLESIKVLLIDELNRFAHNYSRFDKMSLITRLNSGSELINPPSEMVEMFKFARDMFEFSDGAFNISVGGRLQATGYGKVLNRSEIKNDFWDNAVVSDSLISIPNHSAVDFGGFGKGWLIDKFVAIFDDSEIDGFIINGGGDLFVQSNEPIEILLEHPFDSSKKIGQTKISHGALAASSIIKRTWTHNGKNYNHIINPIDGKSAGEKIIGSFVRADSALIADTMATILIIRPELNDILVDKFGLKTILIDKNQFKS